MKINKLLLTLILMGLVTLISAWYLFKTNKESISPTVEFSGLDLSSKIVFKPEREYSIKNYLVKDESKSDDIKIGRNIDSMIFQIPLKFVDYQGSLWNADCNDRPLLEKKSFKGWQVLEKDSCLDKNSAGSFIQVNQTGETGFSFRLLLGRIDGYKIIPVKLTGTYRIRWDMAYDCQSELIGEKGSGNVRYSNCKKAVSYSPEFKIIP